MHSFLATEGNRKSPVFLFNMSPHYYIHIVKCLSSSRDDMFENLGETTVLTLEFSFPVFVRSLKTLLFNGVYDSQ